jgi:proliferating cell nuclear antigen
MSQLCENITLEKADTALVNEDEDRPSLFSTPSPIETDGNILTIKTVQISPFRTLMTALKDILIDTNIRFQPDGIYIVDTDKSCTILAHVFLDAEKFEFFECKKEKIIIGVNVLHLFKLINSIDNNDTLTISIANEDYNVGIVTHLTLKYENAALHQCKIQRLRLIEPDHNELEYPDITFSSEISLSSNNFQKVIRDLSGLSDKIEIKSVGSDIIFKCKGQFAEVEICWSESDGNMEFIEKPDSSKVVHGEFSLKNLGYFIKCTNLCGQIEMYLENDYPLVIRYDVASLGYIKMWSATLPSTP